MSIVHAGDKIGGIAVFLPLVSVGNIEVQMRVFDVGAHLRQMLQRLRHVALPAAIQHNMRQRAFGVRDIRGFARQKVDLIRTADAFQGVQNRLQATFPAHGVGDAVINPVRGRVRVFIEQQQLRKRLIFADETGLQPGFDNGKHLREKPGFDRRACGCAEFAGDRRGVRPEIFFQDQLGEEERDLVPPPVLQIVEAMKTAFADNRRGFDERREIARGEFIPGGFVKVRGQAFAGELAAVADHAGKFDAARLAFR